MWYGFIQYNDARSSFFLHHLSEDTEVYEWLPIMEEAIKYRSKLNILIEMVVYGKEKEEKNSHLKSFFLYQEELARLVKLNLEFVENSYLTNENDRYKLVYKGVKLTDETAIRAFKSLYQSQQNFAKTDKCFQDVLNRVFSGNHMK
ncbi:hypothetical protein [Evansella tamaricis]|uniref:Uncharacterized protein n=1 Tax=Evansella tamaricis TaxID=2069301 RepID=A0ABS6JFS5_9BACI|nr:hypothetical protein [Evansella tamaricis]MBU9711682.1 hypothetical protein [Evansella tamaricis]